jgi:hypothetical protein
MSLWYCGLKLKTTTYKIYCYKERIEELKILQIKFINCYSILTFLEAHMLHQIGQTIFFWLFCPISLKRKTLNTRLWTLWVWMHGFTHHSIHGLPWSTLVMPNAWQIFLSCIYCHTSLNLNPLSFRSQGKSHITTSSLVSFVWKQQRLNLF